MSADNDTPRETPTPVEPTATGATGGRRGNGLTSSSPDHSKATSSLVGCRLGDYQLLRKLGQGGMADVYAARHLTLGRDVAIKVLRRELARDGNYVERFRREARAAAKLNHPSIVQVYDVGSFDSLHYIAQELIDGGNLREYLARVGTISLEEAIEVLLGVGGALEAAAEMGITHRDIKPENVMRSSRGAIKVADFGLARLGTEPGEASVGLTQAGLTMGTPRYMSPEQVQGQSVDVRSDLYSLGVTAYQLLAGRPPFEADDPLALAVMHLHETPPPLDRARGNDDLPEWLIAVVSKLMQKAPELRFQSPTELLAAVEAGADVAAGTGRYGPVGVAAATARLQRLSDEVRARRRRRIVGWTAAIALPLASAVGAAMAVSQTPTPHVGQVLVPERVTRGGSVEEQFLIAMTRDDPAGWRAVGEYFPSDANDTNADYHHKAMLQLARLHADRARWDEAGTVLRSLISNFRVSQLHRAIAWVRLHDVAEATDDAGLADEAAANAVQLLQSLEKENPTAMRLFQRVVPGADRIKVGVFDTDRAS